MFNTQLLRFESPDGARWSPFGEARWNAYAYGWGNPTKYTDPSGHISWAKLLAVFMVGGDDFTKNAARAGTSASRSSRDLARVTDRLEDLNVSSSSRSATRTGATKVPQSANDSTGLARPQADGAQNPTGLTASGQSDSLTARKPAPKLISGNYAHNKEHFPAAYAAAKLKHQPGVVVGKPPQGVKGDLVTTTPNGYKEPYFGLPTYNTAVRTPDSSSAGKHAHRR